MFCVTQSGLRPVVSQRDIQNAALCGDCLVHSADNMDNSAPYGLSREGQ